jgi:hypothetical protein
MKNINRIKRLVKSDCAGYFTENNYCCSKDGVCVFFRDNEKFPCCRYFEEGVLPLDKDLGYEYRQERQMAVVHKTPVKTNVKCSRCKLYFKAGSNRQNYCEKCKKIVKREQARLSMQKKRNKSA